MTENEVKETKEWLQDFIRTFGCNFDDLETRGFNECVMFLKELEQYRAIGTIEEFKALKEKETEILLKDGQLLYQQGVVDGYAKGIDVYVEKLKYNFGNDEELDSWATYDEIAEQLKAGEKNE